MRVRTEITEYVQTHSREVIAEHSRLTRRRRLVRLVSAAWMTGSITGCPGLVEGDVVDGAVVGLAEAIEALREQLMDAADRGRDQPMQFRTEPVELTVQAAVTKEANGKIGWAVLGLGGGYESAVTQTLTLRLTPLWRVDDGTLTSDFTITGNAEAGDTFGPARD